MSGALPANVRLRPSFRRRTWGRQFIVGLRIHGNKVRGAAIADVLPICACQSGWFSCSGPTRACRWRRFPGSRKRDGPRGQMISRSER